MTFFPNVNITVRRYGIATADNPTVGGYYELGKWIQGNPIQSDFVIKASVQPASGEEMQTHAEGRRVKSMYKCFSSEEVFTTDPLHSMNPDLATNRDEILWDGEIFEIVFVGRWTNNIISHYEWYMMREKELPDVNTPES